MENKIGILTFHRTPNYGAVLQAFALKTYLEKLGFEAHIIDYICTGNDAFLLKDQIKSRNRLKRIVKLFFYYIMAGVKYKIKLKKFADFRDKWLKVDEFCNISEYKALVCGSDQIWNPNITGGFKNPYFGINTNPDCYAISYAASVGDIGEISENKEIIQLIKNLKAVGVRERSLAEFLNLYGIKAEVNIDPTFLISSSEYRDIFRIENKPEHYILVYELVETTELDKIAEEVSRKTGLKIQTICGYIGTKVNKRNKIFDAGPEEFLQLINGADFVITNSFHGVAFSLIFRKQFISFPPSKRSSRILDLLDYLGLKDNIILKENIDHFSIPYIDYSSKEELIESEIVRSRKYIEQSLKSIVSAMGEV